MSEVNNLISNAKNIIENFESVMFATRQTKYIVVKSVTTYIQEQIEAIEERINSKMVDEEYLANTKENLEYMISSVEHLSNLFREEDNERIKIDNNGNFTSEPTNYHVELDKKSYIDTIPRSNGGPSAFIYKSQPTKEDEIAKYVDVRDVEASLADNYSGLRL